MPFDISFLPSSSLLTQHFRKNNTKEGKAHTNHGSSLVSMNSSNSHSHSLSGVLKYYCPLINSELPIYVSKKKALPLSNFLMN